MYSFIQFRVDVDTQARTVGDRVGAVLELVTPIAVHIELEGRVLRDDEAWRDGRELDYSPETQGGGVEVMGSDSRRVARVGDVACQGVIRPETWSMSGWMASSRPSSMSFQ